MTTYMMWTLLLCLFVFVISGTESQSFTERQLTPESAVLVQSFRKYLAGVERKRRDELERTGRATSNSTKDPICSLLCTDRKDCGNIIQNFGLYLDPKSALRMCKTGPKSSHGILIQSNYDTSPYCQYLQSHFNICENKTAVMEIGCQFTCEKCKVCDDDECKCSKYSEGNYVDGRYVCKCNKGFRGDGFTCINVNECKEKTDDCHKTRAICTDLTPFWKCHCKTGYSGDGKTCEDVNECTKKAFPPNKACDKYATCINTIGSYYCTCKTGYSGDGFFCEDEDECKLEKDTCARDSSKKRTASCTNNHGSYTCKCHEGYKDVGKTKDGRNCVDRNECLEGNHNCHVKNAKCINTIGSFRCTCNAGYTGDGVRCVWNNPCLSLDNRCHKYARCIPNFKEDKYRCECLKGFKSIGSPAGENCANINECTLGTHGCDRSKTRATCTDTVGSYNCSCNIGWEGNGTPNCADINECYRGTHNCAKKLAICVNTPGSFRCTCPKGYALAADKKSCVDVNECLLGTHNCHANAKCTNTVGSYICECKIGFEGSGQMCRDIDECRRGTHNCDAEATCSNTIGSFTCKCNLGFAGNGVDCKDIDECKLRTDNCNDTYTTCKNTIGSFRCLCNAGFEPLNNDCRDINECLRNTHPCSKYATCTNIWGSCTCRCNKGFTGDGMNCTDFNECLQEADNNCPRPKPGVCTNTIGSYRCSCKKGYEYKGNKCIDIDECALGIHACRGHSHCVNTIGSYKCVCNTGFELRGTECVDIDECKRRTDKCDKKTGYATCTNTIGSYTCKCNTGFEGNGFVCRDINECERGTDKCHSRADCTNTIGSYNCSCRTGFEGSGFTCTDINECTRGTHTCDKRNSPKRANCTNTIGSFTCKCNTGFAGNGHTCRDINECTSNTHNCHRPHAECSNTIGSFTCKCKKGFRGDGYICRDIDECKENTHNCHRPHAWCDNTIGSFRCRCKTGYTGDGFTCTAIKSCKEGRDDCSKYAKCTDLSVGGTYSCDCFFGFFGNGKTCTGSRGRQFLVLFMKNIDPPTETKPKPKFAEIYIASVDKSDVKVSSSGALSSKIKAEINQRLSMTPNSQKILRITHEIRANDFKVENKAVMVETTGVTSVFALNHDGFTSDSTLILPIDRLGTKYIVPSTEPHNSRISDYNSQIAFAAAKDRTRVTVTLKLKSGQSIEYQGKRYRDGGEIIVTLNKYQTFELAHNGDLTGTMIFANNPVAVFSGNRCNKLNRYGYCSHLVEQIPPVESLDDVYVVPPHVDRSGTQIRVVAAHGGSTTFSYTVDKSKSTKTIGTYQNFDIKVTGKQTVVVEAKQQVLVLSFALAAFRSSHGDPYMTMVPGVNQYVHQYHIAVPQGFEQNYLVMIVQKSSRSSLLLDNDSISSANVASESTVNVKGTDYVVLTVKNVKSGGHRVETKDKSRFGLMVYGHSHDDGYGFAANILGQGKI
ncbi:fibrillin-1-like isoform X2 [Ostrea edulis]|nr:fibrillin-1-like isoform X2 [Ostrea edulis]XP_055995397.1 fibrillin-1-like isoform X2 [Ostrea edulis]XP_055995398.1 fibrillin-1-like isoform X2 [Ostrea edulis]XP_055995399.1 fibrillin-1-like isoform X2 [Ostrea edulis]